MRGCARSDLAVFAALIAGLLGPACSGDLIRTAGVYDGAAPVVPDAQPAISVDAHVDAASPWRLVWQDEFDGPAGAAPDPGRWKAEIGGHGWGNEELQFHTDRASNVSLDGTGNLAIVARAEEFGGRQYTSARITTRGNLERTYGRFEARLQLPTGQGLWPAFWMLGADFATTEWPSCGEIDIMEQKGQQPTVVYGSLHGPGYSGGNSLTRAHQVVGAHPAESFHLYAVEWYPGRIVWMVDGEVYYERTSASVPDWGRWVYDHPFFLILNVAVGGHFVGAPSAATQFPQTMLVDYVRVYELAE